ncbi:MAG: hypothetical protein HY905_01000 [Deltaproteobacteria bacterium]|nr:hypothetical protein [Deltaproteobacteria bacterium]
MFGEGVHRAIGMALRHPEWPLAEVVARAARAVALVDHIADAEGDAQRVLDAQEGLMNREKRLCETIQNEAAVRLRDHGGIDAREDSRAFGALIERRIVDAWPAICRTHAWTPEDRPGRRTIYDVSCIVGGRRFGLDVKTTDTDGGKYTDGGVCSVDNLLRFLAGKDADATGVLVVLEVTHARVDRRVNRREIASVVAAPLHALPMDVIRIENLGTGQVRLDRRVREVIPEIDWERPSRDFLQEFVELAKLHYAQVGEVAARRRAHLDEFAKGGYTGFVATRGHR